MTPEIPTAISEREAHELAVMAKDRRVLEIGSLLGYSTVVMAQGGFVTSVDPHEGYPNDNPRPTLEPFVENLRRYGVADRVEVHVGYDYSIVPALRGPVQFAFIDGTGYYDDTYRMICEVWHHLGPGDKVAVHDYGLEGWPEVALAVDDFRRIPGRSLRVVDTLAILERR